MITVMMTDDRDLHDWRRGWRKRWRTCGEMKLGGGGDGLIYSEFGP